jgi:hypothetical protein
MKTSGIRLHILQMCTSYFIHLYLIIFNFFAFPLFQWNFYVRLQGVPISYPQLLLHVNLWVDFNENFRHSSTYIGDVHLYKCYMRFDYFQLFWFPILKNGFCHTILEGVPITYPQSLLDLWMDFNETCVNQLQNGKI